VFTLFTDEHGVSHVRFGDGILGAIPTTGAPIVATYRHGFGSLGNIGPGAISSLVAGTDLALKIASVTNAAAFTGGADVESLESMRRNVPRSLRSLERAVTLEDYASVAAQVPGVAKANAYATTPANIVLYVAPTGGGTPAAQLLTDVQTYLDDRKMVGTTVTPTAPTYVNINVTVSLTVNNRFRRTVVADAVKEAIKASLAFDVVEFGETISKARVFRSTLNIPGVEYFDITAHNRTGSGNLDTIALTYSELPVPGTITVNATGGILPL
jgi:predicted phage baseplate assembly protein